MAHSLYSPKYVWVKTVKKTFVQATFENLSEEIEIHAQSLKKNLDKRLFFRRNFKIFLIHRDILLFMTVRKQRFPFFSVVSQLSWSSRNDLDFKFSWSSLRNENVSLLETDPQDKKIRTSISSNKAKTSERKFLKT